MPADTKKLELLIGAPTKKSKKYYDFVHNFLSYVEEQQDVEFHKESRKPPLPAYVDFKKYNYVLTFQKWNEYKYYLIIFKKNKNGKFNFTSSTNQYNLTLEGNMQSNGIIFNTDDTITWTFAKPQKPENIEVYNNKLKKEDNKYLFVQNAKEEQVFEKLYDICLAIIKRLSNGATVENSIRSEKRVTDMAIKTLINNGVSQLILTGAPGTGKTYTAKNIAKDLGAKLSTKDEEASSSYCFVQFHPSYDYTDFVEGLRPVSMENNVTFKKIDGIFKRFCRKVVAENENNQNNIDNKYFFIIDEINRADLSNVLGELMFCLEKDKRGKENSVQTQYSNLPTWNTDNKEELEDDCFADGFYIPENVVIIGTMNDIDRSVESFDFALRRRFTWFEVEVTANTLLNAFKSYSFDLEIAVKLKDRILELNNTIEVEGKQFGLNKHYFISQGYFTNIPDDERESVDTISQYIWNYRLKSLLEEYIRGEDQESINRFIELCENAFSPETVHPPTSTTSEEATEPDEYSE